jgi:ribose transport system substrate-binding protein
LKRTSILLLLSALVLCLACAAEEPTSVLRFAFIPKALHIPVFDYARTGAERAVAEIGGIEILWRAPETTDELRQKEIFESFVAQRVDGIAISCLNGDLLRDSIDRAVESGIPVVTWDSDAPGSKRLAFYGVNDFEAGKVLGQGMVDVLGGTGRIAVLTTLGADNLQKRLDGARESIDASAIEVVEVFDVRDDAVRAAEVIASATQRYPDLDGWLSVGGWPVFVRNALDPVDSTRTRVVAFDTIPPALDILREGRVELLVGQKYFGWGSETVRLLKELVDGRALDQVHHYSGVDIVTGANVDAYEAQWNRWVEGQ